MRRIRLLAPAKVNLTFDILDTLPDGYHQVQTLLQAIDLQDEVAIGIQEADEFKVDIKCTNEIVPAWFPTDSSNLMARAAELFFAAANLNKKYEVQIEIEKNIPIGAGLAGGSTDAAATLLGLNHCFDSCLANGDLHTLAAKLGADVPFCLAGGTCIGTHRGDVLEAFESKTPLSFCVAKPRALHVSTPWAYQQFDSYGLPITRPNIDDAVCALKTGDLPKAIESFGNVFEPVIFAQYPELGSIKQKLIDLGCWGSHLSGSGPAIYGIVADREQAHFIRRKVLKTDDLEFSHVRLSTPDWGPPLEFYVAQSLMHGPTILGQN